MGELLLCNHPIAAMPYYIDTLSLNIYSIEELCYVIEHHTYLMEEHFFDEELIAWLEREVGEVELAEQLRQSKQNETGITKIVEQVLNAAGYLNYSTALNVVSQIREMQHMSVFERRKMRADHYVENKQYIQALFEYRHILQMEEECRKNPVVCGNIWHNQGIIFANLFLFEEAGTCFEKAYKYHMNIESIYGAIWSYLYLGDETKRLKIAKQYEINEQEMTALEEKWKQAAENDEAKMQITKIDAFFENNAEPVETNTQIAQMLFDWKKEYQKNCR